MNRTNWTSSNSLLLVEKLLPPTEKKTTKSEYAQAKASTSYYYETNFFVKNNKFEQDAPNEFTSGYEMRPLEIVVIILILALWILSLRKFVKNFDKLRTTHYREIPYKYKDPQNINHVKIVHNQNESVIYSRDPIKSLRSKSLVANETDSNSARGSSSNYSKSREDQSSTNSNNLNNNNNNNSQINESMDSSLNRFTDSKKYSSSLASLNEFAKEDMASSRNYLRSAPRSHFEQDKNHLNPLYNLSPFIRKSLLDLHQKSMENLAQASAHSLDKNGNNNNNNNSKSNSNRLFMKNSNHQNAKNIHKYRDSGQKDHLSSVKFLESPV